MEDKKFFEEVNKGTKEVSLNGGDVEIELAKSGSSVAARRVEDNALEETDDNGGQLTVDVYQTPSEIIVESPIAGVNPEDIDVSISSETVTIKGKREREQHIRTEDYVYQECYWGKFSRSVVLPVEVDADNAEASIKNGVLTVRLPKLNRSKQKKIKVKSD